MPGDPEECRAHALRCCELAHAPRNQVTRQKLLDLAGTWNKLAAELEVTRILLDEIEAEVPQQGAG